MWWAFACAPGADTDVGVVDTDVDPDPDTDVDTDPFTPIPVTTVSGGATWNVDFGADAEAAGYVDCAYARAWTGGLQDLSAPWLCPGCGDAVWRADAAVTEGRACYDRIASRAPSPLEWLGAADGSFWRASRQHLLMTAQGGLTGDASAATFVHDTEFTFTDADGTDLAATFHIEGALTFGTGEGDPLWGMRAPPSYACGWPRRDGPAYAGDYVVDVGTTLPDALMADQCGQPVRLEDFIGTWLVIDVSARDCGPCQQMATDAPAFLADRAAAGVPVRTITLLAPSLSDTLGITSKDQLVEWADGFGLEDPVLSDRGYGMWVLGAGAERMTGEDFGYPTWVVVGPDGKVRGANVGYGGWDAIGAVIDAG